VVEGPLAGEEGFGVDELLVVGQRHLYLVIG
jgi:hypothetical protein